MHKNTTEINRAMLLGDVVRVSFFVRNGSLQMGEECYFFLMSSMRKMRMKIPLNFTLEFFEECILKIASEQQLLHGIISLYVYRKDFDGPISEAPVDLLHEIQSITDPFSMKEGYTMDVIKEISIGTNLLSNIQVPSPENIYAKVYAKENELNDVILLNSNRRVARSIYGNLLLLQDGVIKVVPQSEGAYISPLMENMLTYFLRTLHVKHEQIEMSAFETQKAQEILVVSDSHGITAVSSIRNKEFASESFRQWVGKWQSSFV